jgi:hypothetical protein
MEVGLESEITAGDEAAEECEAALYERIIRLPQFSAGEDAERAPSPLLLSVGEAVEASQEAGMESFKQRVAEMAERPWRVEGGIEPPPYSSGLSQLEHAQPMLRHENNLQGNHGLQEYQMQLMLLERQNQQRLLLARQGVDSIAGRESLPEVVVPEDGIVSRGWLFDDVKDFDDGEDVVEMLLKRWTLSAEDYSDTENCT